MITSRNIVEDHGPDGYRCPKCGHVAEEAAVHYYLPTASMCVEGQKVSYEIVVNEQKHVFDKAPSKDEILALVAGEEPKRRGRR